MKRSSELTKVRQFENSLRIKRIISKCDLYVPNVKEVSLFNFNCVFNCAQYHFNFEYFSE